MLLGESIVINGDGRQTRDYVYVGGLADANSMALEQPEATGVVNLRTGIETSVIALFEWLREVVGSPAEAQHGPTKLGEQRRSVLDATRASLLLNWSPRVSLDDGLRDTVEHMAQTQAAPVAGAAR